jgi:serine phosphatase RsbU (regulator of sigma subunit)
VARLALDEGVGLLSDDIHADSRFASSQTVEALKVQSLLCVPLLGQQKRRLGLIQLDTVQGGESAFFTKEDLRLLTALALQSAVVVENALAHEQRLLEEQARKEEAIAREVQAGFLPTEFTPVPGDYELFGSVVPAREVSGDLYDCFALADGRLAFFLYDVAGRGMSSVLFVIAARVLGRHLAQGSTGPADTLGRLQAALVANNPEKLSATVVHGLYDPRSGEVVLASAGRGQELLRRANGRVEPLALPSGPALGQTAGALGATDFPVTLQAGETLILYSDSLTEAQDPEGQTTFGLEDLQKSLAGHRAPLPLSECAEAIRKDLERFSAADEPQDDLTLLMLRRN